MVVIGVVLLLFGRGKISELTGDVAQGIKAFKKGMAEDDSAKPAMDPSEAQKSIDHQQPADVSLKARAQTEQKAEGSNV